ncbi:hypothetical protein D3C86_1763750 [compost metagenome]
MGRSGAEPGAEAGSGAKCAASGSTGSAARHSGSASIFFSHAFLYGVNTENGVPDCDSTSRFSNTTWSLKVKNGRASAASALATASSRAMAAGS